MAISLAEAEQAIRAGRDAGKRIKRDALGFVETRAKLIVQARGKYGSEAGSLPTLFLKTAFKEAGVLREDSTPADAVQESFLQ